MGVRRWAVAANLVVAIVAGTGAAALLLFAAFVSFIAGWAAMGAVLVSLTLSIALTVWLARRRLPRSASPRSWAETIRTVRRGMVAAFAAGAVAAGVAMAGNLLGLKAPAQAKIAAALEEHRGDFEALRDMAVADRLFSVIDGGNTYAREPFIFRTPGQLGIPPARVALYRQRMKAAGCPRVDVSKDGSVYFAMASWGAANHGWRMSLVWSKEKPTPLLPTIDGFLDSKAVGTGKPAYSALGDDWYVTIAWPH
jgi:hypothetical protein